MRRLRTALFILLLTVSPVTAFSAQTPPGEGLPDLVALALANNPELRSSHAKWQMFVNRARQASALDDPMVMFKLQGMLANEPFVFNKDPQSAKVLGISQQIPFWGKRAIRQEAADKEAESYRWSLEERKLELARMVKETWYQLWAVDRYQEIVDRNLRLLADFVTIAETKYAVGQGTQQDIYKAGLETSKMVDMQLTLRQQRQSLVANLNYLLARPAGTPVGPIADFTLPQVTRSADQLRESALANRPQIKSLTSLISKGDAYHRLAEKESYPDFNLSFEYMFRERVDTPTVQDPGDNMFTLGVTVNLPVQRERRRAMQAESAAETTMATEELNALKNSITYTINDTLAQLELRRRLIELYRDGIIPQAEQSLESAVINYRVNKIDFLSLLDGRMSLFTYQRQLYESQADYMMRLAQLEAAVGTDPAVPPAPVAPLPSVPPVAPADSDHLQHH